MVLITDKQIDEHSERYLMEYLRKQYIQKKTNNTVVTSNSLAPVVKEETGKLTIKPLKANIPAYYNPYIKESTTEIGIYT